MNQKKRLCTRSIIDLYSMHIMNLIPSGSILGFFVVLLSVNSKAICHHVPHFLFSQLLSEVCNCYAGHCLVIVSLEEYLNSLEIYLV